MATHPGVYVEEVSLTPPPIVAAATSMTAFVGLAANGPVHQPVVVRSVLDFERLFGLDGPGSTLPPSVRLYFQNGGQEALIVRLPAGASAQTAWVPALKAARLRREGLYALDTVPFNLLCLPPPAASRDFSVATWARAAAYCRQRGAVLLVDAPAAWRDVGTAVAGMDGLRTSVGPTAASHVAVYHPRLRVPDPQRKNGTLAVAPCGAVAGLIARTDATRGVWKAPAGIEATLSGATGLVQDLNDATQGPLNAAGLNGLRTFAGKGVLVWGARTLAGADSVGSEWKYLPVRRLALHVQQSVVASTGWVVFEPNDEPLWTRLRAAVQDFLSGIWRQGGLMGQKPDEAFFVRCDRSTMTAADIAAGRVQLLIGLAALKPAEFVALKLTLQAAS